MENKWFIVHVDRIEDLKPLDSMDPHHYIGYVYVMETGLNVKIGSTSKPFQRFSTLKRTLSNYGNNPIGRIALSSPHLNFRENEFWLHECMNGGRVPNTELFSMSFEDALYEIDNWHPLNCKEDFDEYKRKVMSGKQFADFMANTIMREIHELKEKPKCINCGSKDNIQWHYIVPLAIGGKDVGTNMMPLCQVCKYAVDHGVTIEEARAKFK